MPISGKVLIKKLRARGWLIKSQRGSHVKLVKGNKVITIPVHGNQDLGKGLLNKIIKDTGEENL